MATLTATDVSGNGFVELTANTLTASDTFTYRPSTDPMLVIDNGTAGPVTVNIDGSGGTTVNAPGLGSVDVSGGYSSPAIAAGEVWSIRLKSIDAYVQGTIAMTGASGATAYLLEF